jgi:hypothetical protein
MFIKTNESPIPYFKSDGFLRAGLVLAAAGIILIGFFGGIYDWVFDISWGV